MPVLKSACRAGVHPPRFYTAQLPDPTGLLLTGARLVSQSEYRIHGFLQSLLAGSRSDLVEAQMTLCFT